MTHTDSPFDGDASDTESSGLNQDTDSTRFREVWPQLEALIESSGRSDKLNEDIASYISTLREEEKSNGLARKLAVSGIAAFLVAGWVIIYRLIIINWGYFFLIGSNAPAPKKRGPYKKKSISN